MSVVRLDLRTTINRDYESESFNRVETVVAEKMRVMRGSPRETPPIG